MSLSRNDPHATRVYVHLADRGGGWVLLVERDGEIVASEHRTDWHRVERRRTLWETRTDWRPARVAAAILAFAAAVTAASVSAQGSQSALWSDLRAGGVATSSASAQRLESDEIIGRLVTQQLLDEDVTTVNVSVTSGIVTLRGTVRTLWIKQRAIEAAAKVDDVISVFSELIVPRGESDERIAAQVAQRLQRYVFFSIFDDADVEAHDGIVTLTGRVTLPYKADAFADLAAHVPGVQEVRNEVRTLPVSLFDDQLRYAVARRIYGDSLFSRYATQANPPVHIVVERGRVTLTGVVLSQVERRKAEAIARGTFAVMGVTNNLRIETDD
jgi:hyperosmotically inducible protein